MLEILNSFYRFYVPIFRSEKETENYFSYKSMNIKGFRGLDNVFLNFSRNDLVLLLGLNESGKTSILKAIECFDFNNDPEPEELKPFFTSIRNKHDINCSKPTTITAEIEFSQPLEYKFFEKTLRSAKFTKTIKISVDNFIASVNENNSVNIYKSCAF